MAKKTLRRVLNESGNKEIFCWQLIKRTNAFKNFLNDHKGKNRLLNCLMIDQNKLFEFENKIFDLFMETEVGKDIRKKLCPKKTPQNIVTAKLDDPFLEVRIDLSASKDEIMRQLEWYIDKFRKKVDRPVPRSRGGKIRSPKEIFQIFKAFDTVEKYGPERAMRILHPETVGEKTAINGIVNEKYRQIYDWHREIKAKLQNL